MQCFLISVPPWHSPCQIPQNWEVQNWIQCTGFPIYPMCLFYFPSVFLTFSWRYFFLCNIPSVSLASLSLANAALSRRIFTYYPVFGETGENGWSFLLLQYSEFVWYQPGDWSSRLAPHPRISRESEPYHLHPKPDEVAWLRLWYQTAGLTTLQSEWYQNKI